MIQFTVVIGLIAVMAFPVNALAATQTLHDQFQVSSGVSYQDIRLTDGSTHNAVRVMEMNMDDPYTKVELGFPSSLNLLGKTTSQALKYDKDGHKVVGVINGSFVDYTTKPMYPMYLISQNNTLIHSVDSFSNTTGYVSQPIAFGIDSSGKGIIDNYHLDLHYTYNGKNYTINRINDQRPANSTVLYTSDFYSNYTETNSMGTEVVVELPEKPSFTFGSTYEGKVISIRKYGDTTKTEIPENGFVLSGHGTGSANLSAIQVGDTISLSITIDDKWKNSSFMLGSGPLLVKDGKVFITMDTTSSRATEVTSRTAVAVDKTGKKVFFVTVDGRQPGYSKGMNLTQFANYLVSLGAYQALNLDGGGSTTMGVRFPGDNTLSLTNSPSDGVERAISTILMAVSTEPATQSIYYRDVKPGDTHYEGIQWLTKKGITGYEDGTFGVGKSLTRPHAAIMFTRALGLSIPSKDAITQYFKDVQPTDLYADFIAAVGQAGIFKGDAGNFNPDQGLTREQMASTLVNAFHLTSGSKHVKINLDNVSPTHWQNVQILADLGITNQLDDFRPKEIVTRGQFATFLYLTSQYLGK
jgi:hypothetical protein